jgi:hypothetical protein
MINLPAVPPLCCSQKDRFVSTYYPIHFDPKVGHPATKPIFLNASIKVNFQWSYIFIWSSSINMFSCKYKSVFNFIAILTPIHFIKNRGNLNTGARHLFVIPRQVYHITLILVHLYWCVTLQFVLLTIFCICFNKINKYKYIVLSRGI